jgi:regulator of cell morphogenesis and NO signaling
VNQPIFDKAQRKHLQVSKQYVPVVARVHGGHHPEFFEVQAVFKMILEKAKQTGPVKTGLAGEFARLREITDHYTVPDDVCESYEAVYGMLAELDRACHKGQEQ